MTINLKNKPKAKRKTYEQDAQAEVFRWARDPKTLNIFPYLWMLHANLNGVYLPGFKQKGKAKAGGMESGVPDIFLPHPIGKYHGLWIEMKHKPNKLSPKQLEWAIALDQRGYAVRVCYGARAAIQVITHYCEIRPLCKGVKAVWEDET